VNARKEIREALLIKKMKHWALVARHPFVGKGCPAWRARKNFWALQKRYPGLAAKYGLTATSVF
jgi:hypothetical protein